MARQRLPTRSPLQATAGLPQGRRRRTRRSASHGVASPWPRGLLLLIVPHPTACSRWSGGSSSFDEGQRPSPTIPMPWASKGGMHAFTGLGINMRHLFAVRRTLLGIGFVAVLVIGFLAVLRATTSGPPAKELSTGSLPRAAAVPKSPSGDPMVAFLSAASTQLTIPAGLWAVPLAR